MSPRDVIVAENDPLMAGIIESVVRRLGCRAWKAADGIAAVELAAQVQARLVLLDINMPKLNGLLACEQIRALPGYDEVPIVMLTGYDDPRLRLAARRLGANGFLPKPILPGTLLARLEEFLADVCERVEV